jgi:hypothetical protein
MIIECATCMVRDLACHDCVVSVLLGFPGAEDEPADLQMEERAALAVLASSGLVPPLRLLPSEPLGAARDGAPGLRPDEEPPRVVGVGV